MIKNELKLIDERKVLEKDFKIYGTIDNPLFLAKDVAKWINHSNSTVMLKTIDNDEKIVVSLPTKHSLVGLQGNTQYTFLTEDGLYEVLMQSRKPIAKQFKKEVKNILKTIRKTGGYVSNEDLFVNTYLPFADENTKNLFRLQLNTITQLNRKIEKDKPLVDFATQVNNTTDLIDVGALAKLLHDKEHIQIGRTKLFTWLRDNKFLRHNNEPYQKWINCGLFKTKEYTYMKYGQPQIGLKTYITGKGQIYLTKKICESHNKGTLVN